MEPARVSGPRACHPCAVSKAKCIWLPDRSITNGKCRRCNRLNKDCTLQTPAVRKTKPQSSTRVAQLEERLEGLASLVRSSQQVPEHSTQSSSSASLTGHSFIPSPQAPHQDTSSLALPAFRGSHGGQSLHPSPQSSHQDNSSLASPHSPTSIYNDTEHDPDALLTFFRTHMSQQFPFVVIPPRMTAHDLGQDKPVLLKTIVMVTTFKNRTAQTAMAREILEDLSEQIIMRAEKSLDLLQSLLIHLAWYHTQIHTGRRVVSLLQLAVALVIDLQLHSELAGSTEHQQLTKSFRHFAEEHPRQSPRTLEERRAFLGVIYLSSVLSMCLFPMDAIEYSRYTENCVQILQETDQYPSDQILVQLIRLQQIVSEVRQIVDQEDFETLTAAFVPISSHIKALQTKLNVFKSQIPPHLQQSQLLLMHYHGILTFLTEIALFIPIPSRQATLRACLASTQGFLSGLFSVPLAEYYKITYPLWLHLSLILAVLERLSNFESDDWDATHVQGVIDLSLVLDSFRERFEHMQAYLNQQDGQTGEKKSLLARAIPQFKNRRDELERKRAAIMAERVAPLQMNFESMPQLDVANMGEIMFTDLDDAFWQEIMADWEPAQVY